MSQRATAAGQGFGHGVGQGQGHGVGQVQGHGVIFWRGVRGGGESRSAGIVQFGGGGHHGEAQGEFRGFW
ncbi:hypothetical protein AMTRI_Chr08g207020 [Amborella trichopoda]